MVMSLEVEREDITYRREQHCKSGHESNQCKEYLGRNTNLKVFFSVSYSVYYWRYALLTMLAQWLHWS